MNNPLIPAHFTMKPMIILPPDTMSNEDIQELRANGVCVVVSKDPAAVRFVDPLPAVTSRTEIEQAAIKLSRKLMSPGFWNSDDTRRIITATFIDLLVAGTPLDPMPPQAELEKRAYDESKINEQRQIAREDARAEAAARKAAKQKKP